MRYPPGHREATRARILDAAGRLFRAHGYAASGVDAVMAAVQLTAGGFYSHFPSKDALFAETMGATLASARVRWAELLADREGGARIEAFVQRYLSTEHRDDMANGCALASLAPEAARAGDETRRAVERELDGQLRVLEASLRGDHRLERATAIFALCVGGVVLARAVADPALSNRILKACRRAASSLFAPNT
jgi:TetR/AcrR family transcriptional repressor of nem operon